MTREEASQLWPIVKAYSEGVQVEFFDTIEGEWNCIDYPEFDCGADRYRIKPESKYRPFKDAKECFEEMKKHSDIGWLKSNSRDFNIHVSAIHKFEDGKLYLITAGFHGVEQIESSVMLKSFTFMDGTPFGIKGEE